MVAVALNQNLESHSLNSVHLGMSRREGVGDEKVDNIVFLRRLKEGLLEGRRTVIECPDLCLESCVI